MTETERPASGPVYFESVQYLRGIAAFLVLLAHLPGGLPFAWNRAFRGGIGVDLFFIISGFVMASSIERQGQGVRAAADFAVRRALRIFPLYAVATLTILAINYFYLHWPLPEPGYLLESILTYPSSTASGEYRFPYLFLGWSLSFEIFFYLILVALIAVRRASWKSVNAVLVGLVLIGFLFQPRGVLGGFATAPILLEFGFGFFAYQVGCRCQQWMQSHKSFQIVSVLVFLMALKGDDGGAQGAIPKMAVSYFGSASSWRSVGWGLPALLFFIAILSHEGCFHRRAQSPLKILGDVSYSLYLFHMSVFHLMVPLLGVTFFPLTFLYLGVPILAAWIVHRYIELPLQRVAKKIHFTADITTARYNS